MPAKLEVKEVEGHLRPVNYLSAVNDCITVDVTDLQNPVSTADEAREPEREHIVCCELLNNLGFLHHAQLWQH